MRDSVSNHQPHDCLLNRLFRRRSKKTSKLRVTGLVRGIHRGPGNSPHKWPVTRKMFPFDDVIMFGGGLEGSFCISITKLNRRSHAIQKPKHKSSKMPTLSPLVAPKVDITTTFGPMVVVLSTFGATSATLSDDSVGCFTYLVKTSGTSVYTLTSP